MNVLNTFCCISAMLVFQAKSFAQNPVRSTSNQYHVWGIWSGAIQVDTSKFHVFYDVQWRRDDWGINAQQILLRGGGIYQASKSTSFGLGYAFVVTSPYGDFPVANAFFEHRIWQQLQVKQFFRRSSFTHRYRLEQRFIGNADYGGFEKPRFENRARYFMRYQYALSKHDKHPVFLNVFDEIFIAFGEAVTRNVFDQNRVGATIGVSLTKAMTLELGYTNQYIMLRGLTAEGKNKMENNHTILSSLVWNPRIKKLRH